MLHLKKLKISEWVCNLSENVFIGVLNQSSIYCNHWTHPCWPLEGTQNFTLLYDCSSAVQFLCLLHSMMFMAKFHKMTLKYLFKNVGGDKKNNYFYIQRHKGLHGIFVFDGTFPARPKSIGYII